MEKIYESSYQISENTCINLLSQSLKSYKTSKFELPVKNLLRKVLKENQLTPYAFWTALKVGQNTAYRLCKDPDKIPSKKIMDKIFDTFGWLPGDYLVSEEDWNQWFNSLKTEEKQEIIQTPKFSERVKR